MFDFSKKDLENFLKGNNTLKESLISQAFKKCAFC
jgi:hypothetical protein